MNKRAHKQTTTNKHHWVAAEPFPNQSMRSYGSLWAERSFLNVSLDQLCSEGFHFPCLFMIFPGIPPHVDTHSAFEDTILSLSLGAKVRSQSGICDLIIIIVATDL